jgi:hypothetical protein
MSNILTLQLQDCLFSAAGEWTSPASLAYTISLLISLSEFDERLISILTEVSQIVPVFHIVLSCFNLTFSRIMMLTS